MNHVVILVYIYIDRSIDRKFHYGKILPSFPLHRPSTLADSARPGALETKDSPRPTQSSTSAASGEAPGSGERVWITKAYLAEVVNDEVELGRTMMIKRNISKTGNI
jgi:hypothetical protein